MRGDPLYGVNEWGLFLGLLGLLLAGFEVGFRFGLRSLAGPREPSTAEVLTLQSAILGILGLLLGFTFSMSVTRFEARKELVRDEANAIGTAYLRSKLLAPPRRDEMAALFRAYVDSRLVVASPRLDQAGLDEALAEAGRLHARLWSLAVAEAQGDPRAVTTGLLLQSLNDVIDLHEKRVAALENHVPATLLLLLAVVAVFGLLMTGVSCATVGHRHFAPVLAVAFLIAFTIVIIIDLDSPRRGLIHVSQNSMLRLRDSLQAELRN
jgi:hypothetical protein